MIETSCCNINCTRRETCFRYMGYPGANPPWNIYKSGDNCVGFIKIDAIDMKEGNTRVKQNADRLNGEMFQKLNKPQN